METRAPAVVAVVVTTGPGPGLEAAVASLIGQDYEELSLLVMANGGAERVAERVAPIAPAAFVRVLEENLGFAAACNEAALMVEGSAFLLFCHDDVRLDRDAVGIMVEAAYRTNAGIVTPKIVSYDDPLVLLHVGQTCDRFGVVRDRVEPGEIDHGQQDLERDVFVAPGAVTLVRTDLFENLRGFDPLIPSLGEDLDLCWRAQVAGARIIVAPAARVAHRGSIARGERPVTARGTRDVSRQQLQRRHQLLVVATGWSRWYTVTTLLLLAAMDAMEALLSLVIGDTGRTGAIIGAWRWLVANRRRVGERRRQRRAIRVLRDDDLRRLQVGGASRLARFLWTLIREGIDSATGILPEPLTVETYGDETAQGVGFAAAFASDDEFEVGLNESERRFSPAKFLTSFRAQALLVLFLGMGWLIAVRNLVALPLPLIGRLEPLSSWWQNWHFFFASWSPVGVGTGTPAMPGFGILAFAGIFVGGRMGILLRVALIAAGPIGALGIARLLNRRVSNRARVVASAAYLALPMGLNMIAQGRIDVLVVVAGLPFVTRRLLELMGVPGFRQEPYPAPVPFGHRGWRVTEAGQRMSVIMTIALMTAFAPATLVVVAIIVVGLGLAAAVSSVERNLTVAPLRLLGSLSFNVAVFLLPMTVDTLLAGRRAPEIFGLARGPWSAPSLAALLRGADGVWGTTWWGWLWPIAALAALLLARGPRREAVNRVGMIALITLVVATLSDHHWMGSFTPDLDVLLILYGVCVAVLVGFAIAAMENDLRHSTFGWRQVLTSVACLAMVIAPLEFIGSWASGRFNMPTTSAIQSLNGLTPGNGASYRILWLADPSVLPGPGWSIAPGLAATTSTDGLLGGATVFTPPNSGTMDVVLTAVHEALDGQAVDLGQTLSAAGISTIVVLNASAPPIASVQTAPVRPVPGALVMELDQQSDLALNLSTPIFNVYTNAKFTGLTSYFAVRRGWLAWLALHAGSGNVVSNEKIVAGMAPASAFALSIAGQNAPRSVSDGWAPTYVVPSGVGTHTRARLVLHQFPLNGLLALFTLGLWCIVWLGFGWVQRAEWLFTARRRSNVTMMSEDGSHE